MLINLTNYLSDKILFIKKNLLYLDFSANVWISSDAGANWNLVSGVPRSVAAALIEHSFSNDKVRIFLQTKRMIVKFVKLSF